MRRFIAILACAGLSGCAVTRSTSLNAKTSLDKGVQSPQAGAAYDADSNWMLTGGLSPSAMQSDEKGIFAASNSLQQAAMLKLQKILTLGMAAGTDIYAKGVEVTTADGTTLKIAEVGSNSSEPTKAYVDLVTQWVSAFTKASADVQAESLKQIEAQQALGASAIDALSAGLKVLTGTQ